MSAISSKMILQEKCRDIGKDMDTIEKGDMKNLSRLLLCTVLLLAGKEKAEAVKNKLSGLIDQLD
jgi:hypothetical protein